jgi:hypothetical protein
MRIALTMLLFLLCSSVFAFQVNITTRNNLKFQASSLEASQRTQEVFDIGQTDPNYKMLIKKSIESVVSLFPSQYLPPSITVNIESQAVYINSKGMNDMIPMSVFLSTQISGKNQIRLCDYEIKNNPEAIRTLLAHETGHIIIEWAWRFSGTFSSGQMSNWIWTKSIFEGVADYLSATVNNTTLIGGGNKFWYGRNILMFATYEDAKKRSLINTIQDVKFGLYNEGLLKYKTYRSLIQEFEIELHDTPFIPDPNAEGSWLAGQLWMLNIKYGKRRVIDAILKIAFTGIKKSDVEEFFKEVESYLVVRS